VSGRVGQIAGHDREGRQGFVVDAGREGGGPHHCPRAGLGLIYRAGGHLQMKTDATIDAAAGRRRSRWSGAMATPASAPAAARGSARLGSVFHSRSRTRTAIDPPDYAYPPFDLPTPRENYCFDSSSVISDSIQ